MDKQQQVEELARRIRGLVREIVDLSTKQLAPDAFFAQFLTRVMQAMEAVSGAVWYAAGERQLRLGAAHKLETISFDRYPQPDPGEGAPPAPPDADQADGAADALQRFLQTTVSAVIRQKKPAVLGPSAAESSDLPPLLLTPIIADDQPAGVLFVAPRAGTDPRALRGMLNFMTEVCRQAAIYIQQQRLRALTHIQEHSKQVVALLEQAHSSLDPVRVAFVLANMGQSMVGCDRLSVVVPKGRKGRVLAVSGHDLIQRRSQLIKRLAGLGCEVMRAGAVLRDPPADKSEHPRRVQRALDLYRPATQMQSVAVAPLEHNGRAVGALVAESRTEEGLTDAHVQRLRAVALHGAAALANARAHAHLPFLRGLGVVKSILGRLFGRTAPRICLRLALVALPVLALIFVPYELKVRGPVIVNPAEQHTAYAQAAGIIRQVLVDEGDTVTADQVLARMHDAQLRAQLEDAKADLGAARVTWERLKSVAAIDRSKIGQAKSQEYTVRKHEAQVTYLERQLEKTAVRAPIAGTILDPRPKELLEKPVELGAPLFRVAPLEDRWNVEIQLPEKEIGHVLAARARQSEPLVVTFYLSAYPQKRFTTRVREVAPQAGVLGEHNVVRIVADLPETVRNVKPGMRGEARVHCGRRPLGYVLFRGVIDFIRTHVTW